MARSRLFSDLSIGSGQMARLGRYFFEGLPLHVIQRGNNRQAIFFGNEDYSLYHDWLGQAAACSGVAVHAYVLMTNHVHLLVTPATEAGLPRMMQSLGRRYVRYVNYLYRRTGTLWEGRYRAAPIDSESWFLSCCRYIDLNPVRAGIVAEPASYRWSSYHALAEGGAEGLLTRHALYPALSNDPAARQAGYRELFREAPDPGLVDELRAATNGGWAFGSERFKRKVAEAAGRRTEKLPAGRKPKAQTDPKQGILL